MFLVPMETPNKDRTICAFLMTFPSGRKRSAWFRSTKPINRKEMAEEILTQVIKWLDETYNTPEGRIDRNEFHPGSFVTALDRILTDWNAQVQS